MNSHNLRSLIGSKIRSIGNLISVLRIGARDIYRAPGANVETMNNKNYNRMPGASVRTIGKNYENIGWTQILSESNVAVNHAPNRSYNVAPARRILRIGGKLILVGALAMGGAVVLISASRYAAAATLVKSLFSFTRLSVFL